MWAVVAEMSLAARVKIRDWPTAPACACPAITTFVINWNDSLPDNAARNCWIKPLVPLLVGSRVLDKDGQMDTNVLTARAYLCADAARQFAPLALETGAAADGYARNAAAKNAAAAARNAAAAADARNAQNAAATDGYARSAAVYAAECARNVVVYAGDAGDQINHIRVALVRDMLAVTSAKGATK